MNSLRSKTVSGVIWSVTERFGMIGVKFVMGIVLARLLTPADFGLIAMVTVFFAIAEVFISSGLGMAYIQKKEVDDTDADTVFYTNLGISVAIYLLLYFGAPLIAGFYNQPQLVELTRVMAFVLIINAFTIIQDAKIVRDVNFKKLAKIKLTSSLLSGSIGITAAYYGLGVWALVIRSMLDRFFISVGFWITSSYRPKRRFSKKSFQDMFSFGSWVLITGITREIFNNIYILAIGRLFPVAQLGYYTKAKQLSQTFSQNMVGAISAVSFPVLSRVQDDTVRHRNVMRKFLQHTLLFTLVPLVGLIVVAEPFVLLFLTDKWAPMIIYLQLLCIAGILYPIHTINVQAITSLGKTKIAFKLSFLRKILRLLNIILMYRYGVFYIILGEVVLSFIILILNTWYMDRFVGYGLRRQIRDVWKIVVAGLLAGYLGFLPTLISESLWIHLGAGVTITGAAYFIIQFLINKKLLMDSFALIKSVSK